MLLSHHPGAVVEHGYVAPERMISATSTNGNRIIDIDWRPAFDVYREVAKMQFGVEINRDNFYRYAVHFPFGIVRATMRSLCASRLPSRRTGLCSVWVRFPRMQY